MKIAVTGATGFVGRHAVADLLRGGHTPTLLLRSGAPLPACWQPCEVVRVDLGDAPADVFERAGKPDTLLHLAWGGLPNYRSLHHFEQELGTQYRFLKQMVTAGLGRLVVTGTCFEYGMQSGPLHEELEPRPANPYGLAKDMLRRQLVYLKGQVPFELCWARLFYLHGEGQAAASLWPLLQAAARRGDARFPMSGGEQLRDYLPIGEAVASLNRLALGGGDPGILNLCSGVPVSVRALVEGWIAEHGWNIRPELGRYPYPDHEPMAFWGDRRKLDACLAAQSAASARAEVLEAKSTVCRSGVT